jgi:hypothetical protein
MPQYLYIPGIDSRMDHGDMTKDTIDIDIHLLLSEEFNQLHIPISNCIHEWIPVVGCVELV